jgi:hypothetical protein
VRAAKGVRAGEAGHDATRSRNRHNDWLLGDTITAHFDTAAAAKKDTSKSPTIKQLVSTGHARSLYHMAPTDTAERRPAINHVVARRITIDFDSAKVATVTTVDSVFGIYIEPRGDSTSARRVNADAGTTPKSPPNQKPLPKSIIPALPPAAKRSPPA